MHLNENFKIHYHNHTNMRFQVTDISLMQQQKKKNSSSIVQMKLLTNPYKLIIDRSRRFSSLRYKLKIFTKVLVFLKDLLSISKKALFNLLSFLLSACVETRDKHSSGIWWISLVRMLDFPLILINLKITNL